MKKRLVSLLLTLTMVLSLTAGLTTTAQAADYKPQFTKCAETLYELGLFKGTGKNPNGTPVFDLDKPATRMQGLIMLIRLLGEEEEALAYEGPCHFTDVTGSAAKYAAYAYSKGYTGGTTATTFGNGPLKANAFLTFVLRALGYNDRAGDFAYQTAYLTAVDVGLTAYSEYADPARPFYRDDCARIAMHALITPKKGGDKKLIETLAENGAVDAGLVKSSGILRQKYVYGSNVEVESIPRDKKHAEDMTKKVKAAAKDAAYYGLDPNIAWVPEPKNIDEFLNNVYCCFLIGAYDLHDLTIHDYNYDRIDIYREYFFKNLFELCANKPELMGAFLNGLQGGGRGGERNLSQDYCRAWMDLAIWNASLTNEEIYRQQNQAKDAAYAISKKLHSNGTIKAGMTEMEIAQVYYDYLQGFGVRVGDVGFGAEDRGQSMKYDTVYACLVQKSANCAGKAAAYNALLHIEGISAQGLFCRFHDAPVGNDHVLNYVILDGQEYICDWGNGVPIQTIADAQDKLEFFDFSLDWARANK